jgi:hypothetical protein
MDRLRAMCAAMAHRGPDDEGIQTWGNAGLAMRRLSIIDVAGGHQPIANEEGDIHLVCNGEIYNHRAVRTDLEARGHRFRTDSDVEVILHLYEEYGDDCVLHLRGMFAFALWDNRRKRLVLGRDRLGKKPLFYRLGPEGLTFGSELRLIRVGETSRPEIDISAINHYLSLQYVPSPQTIYKDVAKLPPAHLLVCENDGTVQLQRYWRLSYEPKMTGSLRDATDELPLLPPWRCAIATARSGPSPSDSSRACSTRRQWRRKQPGSWEPNTRRLMWSRTFWKPFPIWSGILANRSPIRRPCRCTIFAARRGVRSRWPWAAMAATRRSRVIRAMR